jgi:dTDP-4-dehydrorhamnose reductase
MRVLLLGAGGMLASDLVRTAPPGVHLVAAAWHDVDITDGDAVSRAVGDARPDVIVNCAAYTNVDQAESEPEHALAVNGHGPGCIGRAAVSARGSRPPPFVVHFSTDYVFDGLASQPYREDDTAQPVGTYGASKLAGERALAKSGAPHLILRTSWLFGLHGRSFPRTMWQRATTRQATRVVDDQVGRPTYTMDLARAVWTLIERWKTGSGKLTPLLHIANDGQTTWYDVARHVFTYAGVPELVTSCTTAEHPTPARRPAYSVLDTSRFDVLTGIPLPPWANAVARFLDELAGESEQ